MSLKAYAAYFIAFLGKTFGQNPVFNNEIVRTYHVIFWMIFFKFERI